jgi:hypothetical protein
MSIKVISFLCIFQPEVCTHLIYLTHATCHTHLILYHPVWCRVHIMGFLIT